MHYLYGESLMLYAAPFGLRTARFCRQVLIVLGVSLALALASILLGLPYGPMPIVTAFAQEGASDSAMSSDIGKTEEIPAGLFFKAGREDAMLEAPTLDSEVEITIHGQVARVLVRQRFYNPSQAWLEGVYVFPLPERSAVDRLVMTVGERRIEGRILEKEEAEKVYREAAAAGKRASLLSSKRPNVFMTSVANIGPEDEILVEIEYQDRAVYDAGHFSYRFPLVVMPRYTPAPAAPLVSGPGTGNDEQPRVQPIVATLPPTPAIQLGEGRDLFGPVRHPDDGLANPVTLRVELDPGMDLAKLESLYHPVATERLESGAWHVTLTDGPVPADRDFVLEWQPSAESAPEAAVFAEELDGDSYLLVSLLPPSADKGDTEHPVQPRDLVFVVDTSGSMHGLSMAQAKAAVRFALDRLTPDDRFNVIRFDNATQALYPGVRAATSANLNQAKGFVAAMQGEGGTEMRPALSFALREQPTPGRLRQVVFLTDGAVSNEHELFKMIAQGLSETRLFTVGIGSAPNSYFMRKAAEMGRGTFTYIGNVEEVSERMTALLTKLERPALTDLAAAWPVPDGQAVEAYPAALPDLYADQPVSFTVRLPGMSLDQLAGDVVLSGRLGDGSWQRRLSLEKAEPAPGVAALWGRARFAEIQDGLYKGHDPKAVRQEAVQVALQHSLVTAYTSLVAVDDVVARPKDEPLDSQEIARNLPHGTDYAHFFGEASKSMKLRSLPQPVLQKANAGGVSIGLPQTATPAELMAWVGLASLLVSLLLLLILQQRVLVARHRVVARRLTL